jgi:hypothetical protein
MARSYYDRYQNFRTGDGMKTLPHIKLTPKNTDKTVKIKVNSRLDIISNATYGTPYYGWLILQANPEYGGLETNIPIGAVIKVPFPLDATLQELERKIIRFNNLYGI